MSADAPDETHPGSAQPDPGMTAEGDVNTSPNRAAWGARHIGPATRELLEADARHFLHQTLSTPCLNALRGCDGIHLVDAEGRRIMDFHGNSVHQVGYGHPRVIDAITRQLRELPFCPRRYTNEPAVALARRLGELAPGDLNRVLFAPGGTGAIGMALKLARAATGRFKTVSMWDSFHGASLDAVSIGGEAVFRRDAGPLLPGAEHAPPPDPSNCPFKCGARCTTDCADYVAYMLEKEGDVAAVISEPVRWTPYIPPPEYWKKIRAACDRHGTLLIMDEIPTCLGRTGRMFACEHYDVVPDMLVIGKGLGGGVMPLAALIAREGLNEAARGRALGHYTHEKNPVACAAGLAAISVIEEEGLLENARRVGEHMLARLAETAARQPLIREVRGIGLLIGVELAGTGTEAALAADRTLYESLARGLSFKVTAGRVLTLAPPLTLTTGQADEAVAILEAALAAAAAG